MFDDVDDLLELGGAELFVFNKEIDQRFIGISKIFLDETTYELLFIFIVGDQWPIQIGIANETAGQKAFFFQILDGGSQGRIRCAGQGHIFEELFDAPLPRLPYGPHGLFLLSTEFFDIAYDVFVNLRNIRNKQIKNSCFRLSFTFTPDLQLLLHAICIDLYFIDLYILKLKR